MKNLLNWLKDHFTKWLKNDGNDKAAHVVCCALIALITGSIWNLIFSQGGAMIGLLIAAGVGLAKEFIWDKAMGRGNFSLGDLLADAYGCLLGALHVVVLFNLHNGVGTGLLDH